MSDVDKIAVALATLKKALNSSGLVVDPALRARIARGHADVDWPADAQIKVSLGPPAKRDAILALQGTCQRLFGVDLPADYVFFLEQHDGLCVEDVTSLAPDVSDEPVVFSDYSLLSSAGAIEWRKSISYGVTHPDGSSETVGPPVLPFYDYSSGCCMGFASSAGVGSPLRVVGVDSELVWKPAKHQPLARSFAEWLEAFFAVGCEAGATQTRLLALLQQRKAQSAVAADLIVPLSLKRSRAGVVMVTVLTLCAIGGVVYNAELSVRVVLLVLLALALLFACTRRLNSNRYLIEIDEYGILDGFTQPERIPWTVITDIGCEGSEEDAALLIAFGAQRVRIDLGGVQAPMQTVLRSATAFWQAAKDARELRDR